jgi:CoA-transferase family III
VAPTSFPLAAVADHTIAELGVVTGAKAIAMLQGATLLSERAMLGGFLIPGRTSAGGGCRLFDAQGDTIALNLARAADRDLLPALFESDAFDTDDREAIAARVAKRDATALVTRGRSMGLAIASERELIRAPRPCVEIVAGCPAMSEARRAPRVVDLSALWAGPLAAHLLWLAGAQVVKVESRTRPDALRSGDESFYALLNQGKSSVVLDLSDLSDRKALLALIADADIVIEAARPRALQQLGIDAAQLIRMTPGLVWLTITGHGVEGDKDGWVGFGDDCGVAGGLTAALRNATGRGGFVGDAIADPLSGLWGALAAWKAWASRRGGRWSLAMSHVVAHSLAAAASEDPAALESSLRDWSASVGNPFPRVSQRSIGVLPAFGENTRSCLEQLWQS